MSQRPLARFEHDLLKYIAEHPGLTSRGLYEGFGAPQGYVRGTIVKALDRLVKKGVLTRDDSKGTLTYTSAIGPEDLDRNMVESFVRDRLKNRLTPLAAYLSEAGDLNPDQVKELEEALKALKQKQTK